SSSPRSSAAREATTRSRAGAWMTGSRTSGTLATALRPATHAQHVLDARHDEEPAATGHRHDEVGVRHARERRDARGDQHPAADGGHAGLAEREAARDVQEA